MRNKKLVIAVVTFTILTLAGTIGVGKILAQDAYNYPPIISKLVERFGLNEDEVKSVFDEARQEHQVQMQAKFGEKLDEAVKNGELTEDQKQAILKKHEEMKAKRETSSLRSATNAMFPSPWRRRKSLSCWTSLA